MVELPLGGDVICNYRGDDVCTCKMVLSCICDERVPESKILGRFAFQSLSVPDLACIATITATKAGFAP